MGYPVPSSLKQMPIFSPIDDSAAFIVKNTFIDSGICGSSPNSCYEACQIKSCLAGGSGALRDFKDEGHESKKMPRPQITIDSFTKGALILTETADMVYIEEPLGCKESVGQPCTGAHNPMNILFPPRKPQILAPMLEQLAPQPPKQVQTLCLSEAILDPTLGSSMLPSVGSAAHHSGNCKP